MDERLDEVDGERGAAAVELALVLPILVMLLVGIVQFGAAYEARSNLAAATREGARAAASGVNATSAVRTAADGLTGSAIAVTAPTTPCTGTEFVTVSTSYPYQWRVPFFGEGTPTLHARSSSLCDS